MPSSRTSLLPWLWISLSLAVGCSGTSTRTAPSVYAIGDIHRSVTTSSPDAQLWFDRGLALTYGFNHEEAIACYDRALAIDPACAMAAWGKAYAIGPNYNNVEMTPEMLQGARAALDVARLSMGAATPVEKRLIHALGMRYAQLDPAGRTPAEVDAERTKAYADAMRALRKKFRDDADVAALTAEALMMLRPWQLWSPEGEPAPETPEIRTLLEESLRRWPNHPALCHLYIHAMEAGPEVRRATAAAETLETLTPGLGHLIHMPSHIYVWTGRYDDVIRVNERAVAADEAYVAHAGRHNFYTLYRLHNYHFVAYGGMFEGRKELAMSAARTLVDEIPPELLAQIPDFLDIFTATPYHVMVRFGMWEEMLREPEPAPELLAARAVWHYARGIAFASTGRVAEAVAERRHFIAARAVVPETRYLFQNPVREILAVAEKVLAGEIAYRQGALPIAFERLREAVVLDENLSYDEPWGWMEPARHALGALLTQEGRYAEAVEVYERNLARFPENGWALHGLAECLDGLGRRDEAAAVQARFEAAWARADTEIPGSCFCKSWQEQGAK